jgi:transposase
MKTQAVVGQQERIDDVPLLFGMMRRMNIAEVLDKHLGQHHLHQGLSQGNLAVGWMAYVLSQSDHRKSAVQEWSMQLRHTLEALYGTSLRPHEFSDDRLSILAKNLARANWAAIEADLFLSSFEVHQLPRDVFRVDATASCGYHATDPDGIMQLGHSKDHRPDLPQLKIMAAVTQPLAFPVSTSVVPGNQPDDVLYWSTIVEVKKLIGHSGLLFVGDCKMASLDNRARIADAGDYYLTPLPHTGKTAQLFDSWVDTALQRDKSLAFEEELTQVWQTNSRGKEERIAKGYEFTRTLSSQIGDKEVTWTERVQVMQAQSMLASQKERLEKKLKEAEERLGTLTLSGKGRPVWREEDQLAEAVKDVLQSNECVGLLQVEWQREEVEKKRYSKPGKPGPLDVAEVTVQVRYRITEVKRIEEKIKERQERMGWRAEVTNAPVERLSLEASVLTYREGAGLERPFHQLKDAPLGIRPLFVKLSEQVEGLTRFLLIALRVLTLIEILVRAKLAQTGEKLEDLHEGQKTKKEDKPTGKRLLRGIARLQLTLTEVIADSGTFWFLKALPSLLVRVLHLLGLSPSLYTDLTQADLPSPSRASLPCVPDG